MGSMSNLEKARRLSGMTVEAITAVIGKSAPMYYGYEKDPSQMTFGQFFALASEMDDDAKGIIAGVLPEVEAQATDWKPLRELTIGEYYAAKNGLRKLEMELARAKKRTFA